MLEEQVPGCHRALMNTFNRLQASMQLPKLQTSALCHLMLNSMLDLAMYVRCSPVV